MSSSRISKQPPAVTPRPVSSPATSAPEPTPAAAPAAPTAWKAATSAPVRPAAASVPPGRAVVCPVLGALIAEGKVPMAADGTVKVADLDQALAGLGMSKGFRAGGGPLAMTANPASEIFGNLKGDQFNVLDLRGGFVKHPGDSAILTRGAFDEQKFEALVSHARNGVMNESAFGEAIAANLQRDAHGAGQTLDTVTHGKQFAQLEFGALLATFGTRDPSTGELGLSVGELRNLYQHGQLPPHLTGQGSIVHGTALAASLELKSDAALASQAFDSLMTATGLSSRGAKLSLGDDQRSPASQAAVSAGKAARCPHMSGGLKLPSGAETINAHTPAGR